MSRFTENHVEDAAFEWLSGLGYTVSHAPDISPEGPASARVSYDQVLLLTRLRDALERLNRHLPAQPRDLLLPNLMSCKIRLCEAVKAMEAVA